MNRLNVLSHWQDPSCNELEFCFKKVITCVYFLWNNLSLSIALHKTHWGDIESKFEWLLHDVVNIIRNNMGENSRSFNLSSKQRNGAWLCQVFVFVEVEGSWGVGSLRLHPFEKPHQIPTSPAASSAGSATSWWIWNPLFQVHDELVVEETSNPGAEKLSLWNCTWRSWL